ncbi:hypothetical protein GE061_009417 [Apolygus lucorum]|uniref:BTB domain-containing protein n=1 Tax=Apolygus lucorum TaxID=248454 RepID=A0A6A4JZA8_APOLU|nr:hypothetical protein GE061_009417 [Apolygus lucorum]
MPTLQRAQTILDSLHEQVKTGHLCDVLLYSDVGSISAHSCILEAFSPFFSELFSIRSQNGYHWSIKQPLQIRLSSITKCKAPSKNNCMQCLAQILQFVYTGNIKPSLLHLQHLLLLSERLKNKELQEVCDNFQKDHSLLYVSKSELVDKADGSNLVPHNNTPSHKPDVKPRSPVDSECNSTIKPPEDLKVNSDTGKFIECKLCSFVSDDLNLITAHTKVFHMNAYACLNCNFSHRNVLMLVDHIVSVCSAKDVICSVCLFKARDSADLVSHVKTHEGSKPFTCSSCKIGFYRRCLWLKHTRAHIYKKTFPCPSCSLKFNTDHERNKHVKYAHASKKHVCKECGFSAPFLSVLENHKLKHRKLKFGCEEEGCDFQTSSEIMLLRHKPVHKVRSSKKVEKSKECSECSMKFTLNKNLVRHMKIHKSHKAKLKCKLCSYETYRSDNYTQHFNLKHHDRTLIPPSIVSSSSESLNSQKVTDGRGIDKQGTEDEPTSCSESTPDINSIKHLREGYNIESQFSRKHNTLMMNDEGDISIMNSNENNSVTLRNIGNLTGTITLDERTGVLTMNNIISGSVFLNETTGELTYINLENDKNLDLNCFNQESLKQKENFKTPSAPEVTKLDEFTGEIIKVSTSNEENFVPEQEFDSFDMDVNDESLDGFDDFDELLFDVFNEEDTRVSSDVVMPDASSIGIHSCPMPHLDESTGLLTFDEKLVPSPKSPEVWSSYQHGENRAIDDSEAYQLLLDEVTGVLHD